MRDPRGYVYFVVQDHERHRGLTKVGWALRPWSRVGELQTANPYDVTLFGYFPGTRMAETRTHIALADYRVRGEWFELGDAVNLIFDRNQDGVRLDAVVAEVLATISAGGR